MRVAGHPAPLRCAYGKTMYLDVEVGPPLGVEIAGAGEAGTSTTGWPETRASLDPGSSLILYTDGLLDAYAELVDDRDLGIGELVDAVDVLRCGRRAARSRGSRPSLADAPRQSVDDTAVVVITTRTSSAGDELGTVHARRFRHVRRWSLRRRVAAAFALLTVAAARC